MRRADWVGTWRAMLWAMMNALLEIAKAGLIVLASSTSVEPDADGYNGCYVQTANQVWHTQAGRGGICELAGQQWSFGYEDVNGDVVEAHCSFGKAGVVAVGMSEGNSYEFLAEDGGDVFAREGCAESYGDFYTGGNY